MVWQSVSSLVDSLPDCRDGEGSSGSGSTSYTLDRGEVSGWRMQVAGTPRSLIDDVIPHEVSHTVLATFYRKIIPRWADEGFASHVETQAVRSKLIKSLTRSLAANRGIAFGPMFSMTDYPSDILPLYAQGYTLTTMLIEAKDERHFLEFLGAGIDSQDWPQSVKTYYGYESLEEMEQAWKQRVNSGGF